jgi:hypothetical protein
MTDSALKPLSGLVNIASIKQPGIRDVISNGFMHVREDRISLYFNLVVYKHLVDEDTKRILASVARKIAAKELPVFFGGSKQSLATVVSMGGDPSQMTRMSTQSSMLEWSFESGVKVVADKDMINFISQSRVKGEIIEAIKVVAGAPIEINFNF